MQNLTIDNAYDTISALMKAASDARLDAFAAWACVEAARVNCGSIFWQHDPEVMAAADKARKADKAYCDAFTALLAAKAEAKRLSAA